MALRNLQLYRNSGVLVGNIESVKTAIEGALLQRGLVLSDGEPIIVRYKETENDTNIKGLFGIAYVNLDEGVNSILWIDSFVDIITEPHEDDYVTLTHTVDSNGVTTLTVDAMTKTLTEASEGVDGESVDGLATALDVKGNINNYRLALDPNDGKYKLYEKNLLTEVEGVKGVIEFSDLVVSNGEVITVVEYNNNFYDKRQCTENSEGVWTPNDDAVAIESTSVNVATDYLVLTISNGNKVYIKVGSLIDTYTAGSGLSLTDHEFSVNVSTADGNALSVDENGLYATNTEYTAGSAIEINDSNEISVKVSDAQGNALTAGENGLYVAVAEGVTIDKVEVEDLTSRGNVDTYWVCDASNRRVEVQPVAGSDTQYTDDDDNVYNAEDVSTVQGGHRYIVITTTDGKMYWAENDATADMHVSDFDVADGNGGKVLRITMNDDSTHDVLLSDILVHVPVATVTNNVDDDRLDVIGVGYLNQTAVGVIEEYIDNYDCGTFDITMS